MKKIFSEEFYKNNDLIKNAQENYFNSLTQKEKDFLEFYSFLKENIEFFKVKFSNADNSYKYRDIFFYISESTNYRTEQYIDDARIIKLMACNGIFKETLYGIVLYFLSFIITMIGVLIVSWYYDITYSLLSFVITFIASIFVTLLDFFNHVNFYRVKKKFTT